MTERCRCIVPYCRHTTGKFDPAVTDWLCGDHWRMVPAYIKKRLRAIRRLARLRPELDFDPQLCRLWTHAKAAAIERAMGIAA